MKVLLIRKEQKSGMKKYGIEHRWIDFKLSEESAGQGRTPCTSDQVKLQSFEWDQFIVIS
jgi:hypothetical protein